MPRGHELTAAADDVIVSMRAARRPNTAIASRLNVGLRAVEARITRLVAEGRIAKREAAVAPGRTDDELAEDVRRLRDKGFAESTIRTRLGISEARLRRLTSILDAEAPPVVAAPGGGADDPHQPAPPPAPVTCRVALSLMHKGIPVAEAIKQAVAFRQRHGRTMQRAAG